MTYKAKFAVCFEIRTKHSTQTDHYIDLSTVKPRGT